MSAAISSFARTGNDRVAFFLATLHGGGAERMMLNLAGGFVKRGIETDLVLANSEGPLLQQIPAGVRVIDLRATRVLTALRPLTAYLRHNEPISLLSTLGHANIVALWARRLAKARTSIVVREANMPSDASRHAYHTKGRLFPLLLRKFYPWADDIIAISQGVAKNLASVTGLPPESISVIHNPAFTPELAMKAKEPLEHPWYAPGEPPVLLGVGRLVKQKDFPTLIRAFHILRKERPIRLIILGEGDERQYLETLVSELGLVNDVQLPGFVKNPHAYMARSATFVFSSAWEGFGNVLVEAMATGTPVVSTDCESGPAEILLNGTYGRLVPVGDARALADAILATLSDPIAPSKLKDRVLEFSLERIVDKYAAILVQTKSCHSPLRSRLQVDQNREKGRSTPSKGAV